MTNRAARLRGVTRSVDPAFSAWTATELKLHARITTAAEDDLVEEFIDVAADFVEEECNRCVRRATWQAVYDVWPAVFYLPRPPLVAVTSIDYYTGGVSTALSSDYYDVDTTSQPGRVALADGYTWPTPDIRIGAITVTYTAGPADADSIPKTIKHVIRVLATHWLENREVLTEARRSPREIPLAVSDLLDKHRIVEYA